MPKTGYFFDSIVRQPPIVEERLDPADNLEEFGPFSEDDLAGTGKGRKSWTTEAGGASF